MKRLLRHLPLTALLVTSVFGGSIWAAAGFHKTLSLQGISFEVHSSGQLDPAAHQRAPVLNFPASVYS